MPYPETIKYIQKQLEEDSSPEKVERIKKALLDHGYQPEIVDKLMKEAGAPNKKKENSGIEKLILKNVAVIFILLIVGFATYSIFFQNNKELLAPKTIKLNIAKLSPIQIEKDKSYVINLDEYVKDKNFEFSELKWSFRGKYCINIVIKENQATLRSIFLPNCPLEENILFEVSNPEGETASNTLKIKIS